jgi:hypothetical protein
MTEIVKTFAFAGAAIRVGPRQNSSFSFRRSNAISVCPSPGLNSVTAPGADSAR